MKHTLFKTRLRADEILKEAIEVWKQSNQSDALEGIENDPAFSLFMTALAYQANEIDSDIEWLKSEIIQDFSQLLVPYELTHARPATAVVETRLSGDIPDRILDEHTVFTLGSSDIEFIPLLKTKVFNASIAELKRIDHRRWSVTLQFKEPVTDLAGLTFLIANSHFTDLNLTLHNRPLSLVRPWDYSNLPLSDSFSLSNALYSKSLTCQSNVIWFDLFARQNVRMFYIDGLQSSARLATPSDKVTLVFEFFDIDGKFLFDSERLVLNPTVLVNAAVRSATLSSSNPLQRVSGDREKSGVLQFLHLVQPPKEQMMGDQSVVLRRAGAERFNVEHLLNLTTCLIHKYTTDYYAFQNIKAFQDGTFLQQFHVFLKKLSDGLNSLSDLSSPSLYLILKNTEEFQGKNKSLNINYVQTNGAAVNSRLKRESEFYTSYNSIIQATRQLTNPVPGFDEVRGAVAEQSLAGYFMVTNDRIVTPADIKIFCYNEMLTRFGIEQEMVHAVQVKQERHTERGHCGYEIGVYIALKDDVFLKRMFEDKLQMVQLLFQKMIEVRSTHLYPIKVKMEFVNP